MWDELPRDKAEAREAELKSNEDFWGGLIRHGCTVLRQDDGAASATKIIQHILAQRRPVTLQIQEEIADGMGLHETGAGKVLKEELEKQQSMYETKMAELQGQLEKLKSQLANLQTEQVVKEQRAQEDKARQEALDEKREMGRNSVIEELRNELKGLREEVESTRLKQERTEAEYRDFTSKKSPWDWCVVM